jgi:hypothetical protein
MEQIGNSSSAQTLEQILHGPEVESVCSGPFFHAVEHFSQKLDQPSTDLTMINRMFKLPYNRSD